MPTADRSGEHYCEEWVTTGLSEEEVLDAIFGDEEHNDLLCGKPAKFFVYATWSCELPFRWLCAEHYDGWIAKGRCKGNQETWAGSGWLTPEEYFAR
jgi:hypothetical protein